MQVHMNAAADNTVEGELSLDFMKKYIAYCRFGGSSLILSILLFEQN